MKQDIIESMHYYVDLGLPVIPLCPADTTHDRTSPGHKNKCRCNGKMPIIAGWVNRQETTIEDIEKWNNDFAGLNLNIGLPMGSASGYIGVDIDGDQGEQMFQEMSGGDIPATWEYQTGDGRRLLYAIPVGLQTKKIKQSGEGHNECAILCTGQQTVIPPSMHYSGKQYTWKTGHSPSELDCAMAPKWLIDLVRYERGIPPKISQNIQTAEKYVVDMTNLGNEFKTEELNVYMPEEFANLKSVEVKKKSSSGRAVKDDSAVKNIINKVISEGDRDNTMTQIIGYYMAKREIRQLDKEIFLQMMLSYNTKYMDPPLEDQAVKDKVSHFWEIEAQKSAEYKDMNKKKEFNATQAAQMILNLMKTQKNLIVDYELATGIFYTTSVNKGPWEPRGNQYIQVLRATVRHYLEDEKYGDPSWGSNFKINETMDAMKDLIIANNELQEVTFDLFKNSADLCKYIVVDGKLLDWRSGQLLPWNPNIRATHSFDVGYDPEAKCPHWLDYMAQWIPDEGSRKLIQEFLGYSLIPSMHIPLVLFLDGSGSNGKSMLLNYVGKMFKGVASSLSTNKMLERFGKANLYGKYINICTEDEGDGSGFIKNTSELKALSSGDEIAAEFKGKDMFMFHNMAKLIFATNKVPNVKDKSHGWDRRLKIVKFPNKFANDTKVAMLMEHYMQEETPGIFNWMIEGLRNLMARGQFEDSDVLLENKAEYRAVNEPVEGFLQECTRQITAEDKMTSTRVGISTAILYTLYRLWCEDNYGDKAPNYTKVQRTFTTEMKVKGYRKDRGLCLVKNSDKQQCFYGIMPDIKSIDFYENLMAKLKGYGAMEPEGLLYQYFKEQEKKEAMENV